MKSWYGGDGRNHLYHHSKIDGAQCGKWVMHAETKMDLYIAKISRQLSGSVPDIKVDEGAVYNPDSDSDSDGEGPGTGELSDLE